jgi:hypothetical protein
MMRAGSRSFGLQDRQLSQCPAPKHNGLTTDGARKLELDGVYVLPRLPGTGGVVEIRDDADVVDASALTLINAHMRISYLN